MFVCSELNFGGGLMRGSLSESRLLSRNTNSLLDPSSQYFNFHRFWNVFNQLQRDDQSHNWIGQDDLPTPRAQKATGGVYDEGD